MIKQGFYTNKLKWLAEKYFYDDKTIDYSELRTMNITPIFEDEVYNQMLIHRESINININGLVRTGKTTINQTIGYNVQKNMIRLGISHEPFSIKNIARTGYELSKKMRDPKLNNIYIAVDEFDDLEHTRENSTIEQALLEHMSKIQAGRYIHRGYCSPSDNPDKQSNIILNIDQYNRQTMKTKCYVYYKLLQGEQTIVQMIGYIIIDCKPVIKNWIKYGIEDAFYKKNKTKKDIEYIAAWRRKDWYVDYMCRKFEKMDMVNAKGIFNIRDLDYADIYLQCVEEFKPLTKLHGFIDKKQITNKLKLLFTENVIPTTIMGDIISSDKVEGILNLYPQYYKLENQINALKAKNDPSQQAFIAELDDMLKKISMDIYKQEKHLKDLIVLKKAYYDEG